MRKKHSLKPVFNKAALLFAAIYSTQYRDEPIIIKLGGEVLDYPDPKVLDDILTQAIILRLFGAEVIIVHGGGKQIEQSLIKKGFDLKETVKIDGDRICSPIELETSMEEAERLSNFIVQRIDEISRHLEVDTGIRGYSMHGRNFMTANCKVEGKHTGTFDLEKMVVSNNEKKSQKNCQKFVNMNELNEVLSNPKKIVVCNWIVSDGKDGHYAVNADGAAGVLAIAKNAKRLMFFSTDKEGKILGIHDKNMNLITEISPEGIDQLLEDGTIKLGMVPKAKICKLAILAGVEGVVILNPSIPDNIVNELLLSVEGTGTLIRISDDETAPDFKYAAGLSPA